MRKEFKVIKVSAHWSLEKFRVNVENTLNTYSKEGWEIVFIDYLANTNTAMITVSR